MTLKPSPQNGFYNSSDLESLHPREPDDFRSPFEVDRDRIIYSSAFRRLQAKTQVFVSGEFDFLSLRSLRSLWLLFFSPRDECPATGHPKGKRAFSPFVSLRSLRSLWLLFFSPRDECPATGHPKGKRAFSPFVS